MDHTQFIVLLSSGVLATSIILGFIRRVEKKVDYVSVEHEMLMIEYAQKHNIVLSDLPTRTGGLHP